MFRRTAASPKLVHENVTVRHSAAGDERRLADLAALDSSPPLRGPALVAEADARLLAALPIGSGRAIADPFEPTVELVALLELRRSQLRARDARPHCRRPLAWRRWMESLG
jgi:hypothetical protein